MLFDESITSMVAESAPGVATDRSETALPFSVTVTLAFDSRVRSGRVRRYARSGKRLAESCSCGAFPPPPAAVAATTAAAAARAI
jgi:hypothetical protein